VCQFAGDTHKPFLLVATREHVRVYHLVKQIMVKRLVSGCRHISSMDVHVSGDHVILGTLDRRLVVVMVAVVTQKRRKELRQVRSKSRQTKSLEKAIDIATTPGARHWKFPLFVIADNKQYEDSNF
jgi:hypothetical protein